MYEQTRRHAGYACHAHHHALTRYYALPLRDRLRTLTAVCFVAAADDARAMALFLPCHVERHAICPATRCDAFFSLLMMSHASSPRLPARHHIERGRWLTGEDIFPRRRRARSRRRQHAVLPLSIQQICLLTPPVQQWLLIAAAAHTRCLPRHARGAETSVMRMSGGREKRERETPSRVQLSYVEGATWSMQKAQRWCRAVSQPRFSPPSASRSAKRTDEDTTATLR